MFINVSPEPDPGYNGYCFYVAGQMAVPHVILDRAHQASQIRFRVVLPITIGDAPTAEQRPLQQPLGSFHTPLGTVAEKTFGLTRISGTIPGYLVHRVSLCKDLHQLHRYASRVPKSFIGDGLGTRDKLASHNA